MSPPLFLLGFAAVAGFAALVFRVVVRRAYERFGRLRALETALEFAVFVSWGLFVWADMPGGSSPLFRHGGARAAGWGFVVLGLAAWLVVFLHLGVRRSFGQEVSGLRQTGPYRLSRNPQILVVAVAVAGYVLVRPTWHALAWLALYAIVSHLMVLTEEEHLRAVFGEEYARYASRVPRYLRLLPRPAPPAA